MGLQSGINRLIGAAGTAAALSDLNTSAKSTAKTVKELGVDSKMALKARNELLQKLEAINAQRLNANTQRLGAMLSNEAIGGTK